MSIDYQNVDELFSVTSDDNHPLIGKTLIKNKVPATIVEVYKSDALGCSVVIQYEDGFVEEGLTPGLFTIV